MRVGLAMMALLFAAPPPRAAATTAQVPTPSPMTQGLSEDDLKELVGPIALYPDLLLANVLAASVFPADVVAAQAMRARGQDPATDGSDEWDDSVRFVASFPDVLSMMAEYEDWTTALGEAYLIQAGDVLDAVQALRAIAWDNGALRTNEQQVVVQEGPTIVIEPASPQVIFVPVYTPSVVFVRRPVAPVVIGFGVGVAVGAIWWGSSSVHCSWPGRCVAWGPGWWSHSTRVNVNVNRNVNINRNVNVGGSQRPVTLPARRPGSDGSRWQPDSSRIPSGGAGSGRRPALDDFRGISGGGASGNRIPGSRIPGSGSGAVSGGPSGGGGQSIGGGGSGGASRPQLPSVNRPSGGTARPSAPQARPSPPQARPSPPQGRPSSPPNIQRPSQPPNLGGGSRPSGISRPSGGSGAGGISRPGGSGGGSVSRPAVPSGPSRGSAFQPGGGGGGSRVGGARGR